MKISFTRFEWPYPPRRYALLITRPLFADSSEWLGYSALLRVLPRMPAVGAKVLIFSPRRYQQSGCFLILHWSSLCVQSKTLVGEGRPYI